MLVGPKTSLQLGGMWGRGTWGLGRAVESWSTWGGRAILNAGSSLN